MDQNADGVPGETTPNAAGTDDVYSIPMPASGSTPFVAPFNQTTLPLIVSGPYVASSVALDASGDVIPQTNGQNLALNTTVTGIDVTFDRDMNPATFTAADVLSVVGPDGTVPGPYTVTANPLGTDPNPLFPRTYEVGFAAQSISGSYTVTLASSIESEAGDALDTNENAGVNLLFGTAPLGTATPFTYANTTATPLVSGSTVNSSRDDPDQFPGPGPDGRARHHLSQRSRPRGVPDVARRDARSS